MDPSLRWSIDLARFDADAQKRILGILTQMEQELVASLARSDLTAWGRQRATTLLAEAKAVMDTHYLRAQEALAKTLGDLGPVAAASAKASIVPGVEISLSRVDAARGFKLVNIDVTKFDHQFAKDIGFYVGQNGDGGITGRYERVKKFIADTGGMEASSVDVNPDGSVGFNNGRHRYAALRDAGVKTMPVAMDTESAANARKTGLLARQTGPSVELSLTVSLPTEEALRAIVTDGLVQGAAQAAWWNKQSLDMAFRFSTAVRQGLAAAETNQQIIRRVRGEIAITRRNAAALVQTSVQTVANNTRMATFQANGDVVSGVRWLATLDSHTCARCGARDGMTWKLDGTPIGNAGLFIQPPLHFNDRCVMVPITRLSSLGGGQRASANGPVDRTTTFTEFLDRQGTKYQDETLGPGRAQLWRDGKITLSDLTSGTGRPLTLDQLQAKYQ